GVPNVDYGLDWIFGFQDIDVEDKEDWAQVDGEYTLDGGVLQSLDFGLRSAKHERNLDKVIAQGPGPGAFDIPNWPQGFQNYPSDFGDGLGGHFPRNIWFFTADQLAAFNDAHTNRDPVERLYPPAMY